jgi:hypothetical protein
MKGHTWFKIILFVVPVIVVIFMYIQSQQHKQHIIVKKQTLAFSRDWNEFNGKFTGNKTYIARAKKRQAELNKLRKQQAKKHQSIKNLNHNLNNDMNKFNG